MLITSVPTLSFNVMNPDRLKALTDLVMSSLGQSEMKLLTSTFKAVQVVHGILQCARWFSLLSLR